jgi:hypothetical protein
MRRKLMLAALIAAAAAGPTVAQQAPDAGGIRSETQRRIAQGDGTTDALNWLGLIGLLGLVGLKRGHDEDSYHPAPID